MCHNNSCCTCRGASQQVARARETCHARTARFLQRGASQSIAGALRTCHTRTAHFLWGGTKLRDLGADSWGSTVAREEGSSELFKSPYPKAKDFRRAGTRCGTLVSTGQLR
eukprot:1142065-Pelagomonas_calceolata.AAC.4